MPQSMRVAVLANPGAVSYTLYLHNLTVAAQALGLHLHVVELRSPDELDAAFAAITRAGADALIVIADPAVMALLHGRIADLAATSRLPAMYDWRMYVEAGGLMSYGRACLTCIGAPPPMSTRFSRVPSPPICRWSSRLSSSS